MNNQAQYQSFFKTNKSYDIEMASLQDQEETRLISNIRGYYTDNHSSLIAKVYALISVQLMITFFTVLPMYLHKKYVISHTPEFFWPSVIMLFILLFVMYVTHNMVKLIVSLLFAGTNGLLIGSAIVRYDADVLMQTVAITLGTTIFCSAFVHITKINLHHWGGILFCFLWVMILASFIFAFFPPSNLLHILYSIGGIVLFIAYLLYDTSELRRKQYNYEEEEYIIIATEIYLDIINLFLYLLDLFRGD